MQGGNYMKDLLKKGLALGRGLAGISKEQIEKFVDEMVNKGEVSANESKELVENLVKRGQEEQQELNHKIKVQLQSLLTELGVVTKADFSQLEERLSKLENRTN